MRIGWVVDHPKRDLAGSVLAAYQLASRGASVAIVPMYEQGVDVPRLGLDTLVVNYARDANLDLMRSFAKAGLALYVLDTEGGVLAEKGGNSPPAMAAYVRNSGYADILSGYFFWGGRLHAAFNDNKTMPSGQLHLTGCPRFDFAAPRWRTLLDGERRGYLLVNANFPLVNSRFVQQARRRARGHDPGRMGRRLYRSFPGRPEAGLCQLPRRDRPPGGRPAGSRRSWCARIRSRARRSIAPRWRSIRTSSSTAPEASST